MTPQSQNSIRNQLLIWLLGPLFLIGLTAIYDGYRSARTIADSVSDRVLSGSALAIAERVFVNDDNALEVDIPYVALQMLTSSEDDRVFYRIEDADGGFVTGYRDLELPATNTITPEIIFHDSHLRGAPIRIAIYSGAASSQVKSYGFRVAVAETTNARSAVAQSILVRSLLRQAALLAGVAALIWFVVARALRPLQRLEQAVSRRSPDDVRPIQHHVPAEVAGLVRTINELLVKFSSAISALQNFTSSASHQFRTPLALIKTHLEVAAREESPPARTEAITSAHAAVGDAERLMSQMLLLARLDAVSMEELRSKTCDLSEVAREVCEEFVLQLAHRGRTDVDIGFETKGPVLICAEKTLVQEVIRNLVDNAIKHSGETPKVDVVLGQDNLTGNVLIRDHGEGFCGNKMLSRNAGDNTQWNRISEGSSGLGLSIVSEIVALLDGVLHAERVTSPDGMAVKVSFNLYNEQMQ